MAKFNIVRTQKTLPGVATGVRANIDVDTGGQLIAGAISGLGKAIANEGLRRDLIDASTQLSEFQRFSREEMNRLANSFRDNPDHNTYQKDYEDAVDRIKLNMPDNRRAAREANLWLNGRIPQWQQAVEDSRDARIKDNFEAEGWKLRQEGIETNELTRFRLHLWKGRKLGVYTAEQAEVYLQSAVEDAKRYEKAEQVKLKAQAKEEYDAYVEQIEQEWLVKLRNKELTETDIMSSTLEVDKKQEWLGYVDKQADEILKGEVIVTNEEAKGNLEKMAYDIWSGAIKINDFNRQLRIARYENKTIDDTAYDELLSLAQREHKSYQATAMKERESYALRQLVDLPTEYDLTERLRYLTSQLDIDKTISLRKLQLENYDKYKMALRDLLKDNPDWNADEIYIASQKLLTQYRLTPEQLRKAKELPDTPLNFMMGLSSGESLKFDFEEEKSARNIIYDNWDSLPQNIRDKIIEDYKANKPLSEIMEYAFPHPKTKEERDKLPDGTRYIAPDGSLCIKR